MKAMILGTGHGAPIRPITLTVPRPMLPLVRRPLMEGVVSLLARHGVTQIVVNTAHLAPAIEHYFRDGDRHGVQLAYSFEGRLVAGELEGNVLGSAGGLRRVQDFSGFFDETVVVVPGDIVTNVDLTQAERLHVGRGAVATVVMAVPSDGKAEAETTGPVLYLLEPEAVEHIPPGVAFDIETDLLARLEEVGANVQRVSLPCDYLEVSSLDEYWAATRLALSGRLPDWPVPGREVRAGVHLGINVAVDRDAVELNGPLYIGGGTVIGKGAMITGPAVIGANCVIEPGAIVERCLLDDYTRVASIATLSDRIVYGGKCIDRDGTVIDIEETAMGWLMDDARREAGLDEWQQSLVDLVGSIER